VAWYRSRRPALGLAAATHSVGLTNLPPAAACVRRRWGGSSKSVATECSKTVRRVGLSPQAGVGGPAPSRTQASCAVRCPMGSWRNGALSGRSRRMVVGKV